MTIPRAPVSRRGRPGRSGAVSSREPKPPGRGRAALAGIVLVVLVGGGLLFCITAAATIGRGAGAATEPGRSGNPIVDWLDTPAGTSDTPQAFSVYAGEDATSIGQRLEDAGLIRNATNFRLLTSYYGAGGQLKAGDYSLRPDLHLSEIIDSLRGGGAASQVVVVREGLQLGEIRRALIDDAGLPAADVDQALARDYPEFAFLRERPPGASLEGYLFPATYPVRSRTTAGDLVRQMLQVTERQLTADLRRQWQAQDLTLHEAVTLASIVEREAVHEDERPRIAGVYLNRLRQDMPLQADPTVQYALAVLPGAAGSRGEWRAPLSLDDLQTDSPYNTYQNAGLPPSPIANPGRGSLEAVGNPAATDALFFVARPDGYHVFSRTFEEHLQNIATYQQ